jgi:hypothetical protein
VRLPAHAEGKSWRWRIIVRCRPYNGPLATAGSIPRHRVHGRDGQGEPTAGTIHAGEDDRRRSIARTILSAG